MKSTFKFKLMYSSRDTFVFEGLVLVPIKVLEASFETKGTFLQLAQLLVTHGHIVEDLQCDVVVT